MAELISAQAASEQNIYLKYDDGVEGKVDLAKTIENNCFNELKNPEEFEKVYHDKKTNELCWPSGVRLCTNALHEKLSLLSLMNRLKIDIDNE